MATRNELRWTTTVLQARKIRDVQCGNIVKLGQKAQRDTDANDDGDDNATAHFTACVALHNWACARGPVPFTFHHTHIGSSWVLPALHIHLHAIHGCLSLTRPTHSLLLSLPPVCLPFPLLPPQRRAAAGAQQEDHGKLVRLRQQRGWGHLQRPLPHHKDSRTRGSNWEWHLSSNCVNYGWWAIGETRYWPSQ